MDGAGAVTYWSNDGTSTTGSEPDAAVPLVVNKGIFSVLLGNATLPNMTMLPNSAFNHADVRLRTWFSDGVNGFELLTPDQRIAAVGYAIMASSVMDGAITSAMIAPGAVQSGNIAPGAVTAGGLSPGSVTSTALAAGAVTSSAIAPGAVTAGGLSPGAVTRAALASGAVTSDAIAPGAVTAGGLSPGAVTSNAMGPGSVGGAALQQNTVEGGHLAPGAVGASALANSSVGEAALQQGSIKPEHFSAGAVGSAALGAGAVGAAHLQKPPGSGTISGSSLSFEFGVANFTHGFGGAFSTPPVVTLSIGTPPGGAAGAPPAASVWVTSAAAGSFSGRVDIGASAQSVDSSGIVGEHPAGALIEDVPAFSFFDRTNSSIKYVRLTEGSQPLTVATSDKVHGYSSLAYVNGGPAIAYHDLDGGDEVLRFLKATDNIGEKWEDPPVTIAYTNVTGGDLVFLVVNGRPAICYQDQTNSDLNYVRATVASGIGWGTPATIDSQGASGRHTFLLVSATGEPVIASYDPQGGNLKIISESDAAPRPFTINWIALEP